MLKIALVDDSVILRSAIKNVLESSGFDVAFEANGSAELFAKLDGSGVGLILLDIFFPTENGLDILAKLKKHMPQVKVLIVTGLRQDTILEEAQRLLKEEHPSYSLIVYDAARPMSVQQTMWNAVKGTPKYIYVSNPARGGGLHNYGLAVDVSIVDGEGKPLPMGTPVDHLGREAHITAEAELVAQGKLTEAERQNRLLLRRVMKAAGFRPLPSEWWHFNRYSRQTAKERFQAIP